MNTFRDTAKYYPYIQPLVTDSFLHTHPVPLFTSGFGHASVFSLSLSMTTSCIQDTLPHSWSPPSALTGHVEQYYFASSIFIQKWANRLLFIVLKYYSIYGYYLAASLHKFILLILYARHVGMEGRYVALTGPKHGGTCN